MNILPKKRWHVRTKANIERVRKDEAEAREHEEQEKRRIQIAEREAKIDYLRKRKKTDSKHEDFQENVSETLLGNLDNAVAGRNKEHDLEEKEIKENYEKKIGVLCYLSKSESESKPWYLESKTKQKSEKDGKDPSKNRSYLDPLNDIKRFVSLKEKSTKTDSVNKIVKCDKSVSNKKKTIEELRAIRLQRERKEHEREKKLVQHQQL